MSRERAVITPVAFVDALMEGDGGGAIIEAIMTPSGSTTGHVLTAIDAINVDGVTLQRTSVAVAFTVPCRTVDRD